jgi:hypothetical protein
LKCFLLWLQNCDVVAVSASDEQVKKKQHIGEYEMHDPYNSKTDKESLREWLGKKIT